MIKRSEELKAIDQKIEKLTIQKNILKSQVNENLDRKERTRRLIQKGALLEKYFDVEHLTPEETEEFLKMFAAYVVAHKPEKFKKN
jgi:ABC-type phosphate transport system auxiliary subunit